MARVRGDTSHALLTFKGTEKKKEKKEEEEEEEEVPA